MHNNPVPVCLGIIPSIVPGNVVFIERIDGGLALPGGYVDKLENVSHAINRECREETELELDASKWQLFFSAVTPDNKLLLFSYYELPVELPQSFLPNEEVLRVFSASWTTTLRFPLHEQALHRWAQTILKINTRLMPDQRKEVGFNDALP